jgi:hypothetical protein
MIIITGSKPTLRLKQAEAADMEDLRVWKNANREWFFYKKEITPEQQAGWFAKHQARKYDVMFMAQERDGEEWVNIGCMGFRLTDTVVDLYNIMRGRKVEGSQHSMGEAFSLMNAYLAKTYALPITCEVLTANPARNFYERNHMTMVEERSEPEPHVIYKLDNAKVAGIDVKVQYA